MSRIVIDATTAQHARGGIGVVANGLIGALADERFGHDITVIAGPGTPVPDAISAWRPPLMERSAARIVFQRFGLAAGRWLHRGMASASRLVLLDSYVPSIMLPGSGPEVSCFVHDVLPLTHPRFFTARKDVMKRVAYREIRRRRPVVYTSTEFTAAEIRRELGLDAVVAEFGCGQLTDAEADALLGAEPGPHKPYVLYVGAIEERKDLATLVAGAGLAFRRMGSGWRVAIIGNWRTPAGLAFRRRAEAEWPGRVRFLGRRDEDETMRLLRGASALAYPSLAEGFGLPVLEGFAVGTPVIASAIPSITTWAGDAASYFAPGDPHSLAEAIIATCGGAAAAQVARGREVAERYRWRRFAERLIA